MSRDWTPRESYENEQLNIAEGRGDKWHFLEHLEFHGTNGTKERICPDEELVLRKLFPVLGKLISSTCEYNFLSLYEKLSGIEGGIELLHSKDRELAAYIETGIGNKDSVLIKWFEGELDPNFYYSEHNHVLFGESILAEAMLLANEKKYSLEDKIASAISKSQESKTTDFTISEKEYDSY